jgi:hypothetical protein
MQCPPRAWQSMLHHLSCWVRACEVQGPTAVTRVVGTGKVDRRRYNAPTASEVAGIIPGSSSRAYTRDIIFRKRDGQVQHITDLNAAYQPLHFPLLFPRGEPGAAPPIVTSVHARPVSGMALKETTVSPHTSHLSCLPQCFFLTIGCALARAAS